MRETVKQSIRKQKIERMSAVWIAVKNSFHCKSNPSEVYEPKPPKKSNPKSRVVVSSSSFSASSCKSTFKDVVHGRSKRLQRINSSSRSPLSIRSNDLINPVTHYVSLTNSELKITKNLHLFRGSPKCYLASPVPQLRLKNSCKGLEPLSNNPNDPESDHVFGSSLHYRRSLQIEKDAGGKFRKACHKCGEPLARQDVEEHYLSKHSGKLYFYFCTASRVLIFLLSTCIYLVFSSSVCREINSIKRSLWWMSQDMLFIGSIYHTCVMLLQQEPFKHLEV